MPSMATRIIDSGCNLGHSCNLSSVLTDLVKGSSLTIFCHYSVILGIRKELYVWCIETEELVKTLDAHFARIVEIHQLTMPGWNAVITASIDRTVKVWNINYIFEPEHHIDRHEPMN
jgi:hypothetical protein